MLDRKTPPAAYPIQSLKIPYPDRLSLVDVPTMIVQDPVHPIVNMELLLKSGKQSEKIGGESHLAAKMLLEGTSSKSGEEFQKAFEYLGSMVEVKGGYDLVTIKVHALKKHFKPTVDLLTEALTEASFPEPEFHILHQVRQSQLTNQLSKNSQFATLKFNEHFFGGQHPVGKIIDAEMIRQVGRQEAWDFCEQSLYNQPRVILSGHIEKEETKVVEEMLTRLSFVDNDIIQQDVSVHRKSAHIPRAGTQSSLRIGSYIISRNNPEIHSCTIANTLLGGFFGSRLMTKIREEKGLTYGIYSTIVHLDAGSYWMIGSELMKEKTDEAQTEISKEIERLATELPEEKELGVLKNYLRGKSMMSLDSVFSRTSIFKSLFLAGLEWTYIDEYLTKIDTITPSEISNQIERFFLLPDKINLVVG